MTNSIEVLIGMAVVAVACLAAFAVYRQRQRQRVRRVRGWVMDYLTTRYGKQPNPVSINCSDDPLWPVLVDFDMPLTGVRHSLRFICPGPNASFSLLSEKVESASNGPLGDGPVPPAAASPLLLGVPS